jgi:dipeptidyl aminopeptidase/acylaminoacyl peptidase
VVGRVNSASEGDWWLVELNSAVARRFAGAIPSYPAIWSPAGDRIAYQVNKSGPEDIYVKPVDGGGAEEPLVASDVLFKNPVQWSPDGKYVMFNQPDATGWDIWRVPLAGDRKPELVLRNEANERGGCISPDGRWITYSSDESGRDELYVQSYPAAGQRWQLTTGGVGTWYGSPTVDWSRDGRELLLFDGKLFVIDVDTGPTFKAGTPRLLFAPPPGLVGFSTTSDHQRFLMVEPVADAEPTAIELDLNWAAALEKR